MSEQGSLRTITRQQWINAVADRWDRQYPPDSATDPDIPEWMPKQLWKGLELRALGPTPDADDVDEIIGNGSWTRLECTACGTSVDAVAELRKASDCDDWFWLCMDCAAGVMIALAKLEAAP